MKAFEEVKPSLIITVPLVIEKIYKNVIQPIINKKTMKWALSIPLLDGQIYGQIRKKLIDALGGRFKEVIIGGAAMNPEVEEFFQVPVHHRLWHDGVCAVNQLRSLERIHPDFFRASARHHGSPYLQRKSGGRNR